MAYRRSRRRKTFSKRQRAAILRIAQAPIETKRYDANWNWATLLNTAGYTSGDRFAIRLPIYQNIPRDTNSGEISENSFIGNEIMMRGFRFEIHAYINTASANPDAKMRVTVYSENADITNLPALMVSADSVVDPDFNNVPTWWRWNTQVAKIHMQRTWTMTSSSTGPGIMNKKFYWKTGRKLTSQADEGVITNTTFGSAKNYNTYCVVEFLSPALGTLNANIVGSLSLSTYFKDA